MLKRIIIAVTFFASAVSAEERLVWNPPEKYDRAYQGTLLIEKLPQNSVPIACAKITKGNIKITKTMKGCAWRSGNFCHVISIGKPYRGIQPRDVIRHEIGHCNGWPANHGG